MYSAFMANDHPTPAAMQTLPTVPLAELRQLLGSFLGLGKVDCHYDSEGNAVASWEREPKSESQNDD